MRPDKSTLAAVAATLGLYRAGVAEDRIQVWRMIAAPADAVRARAEALAAAVGPSVEVEVEVVDVRSTVGGGSLPGETLPSAAVALGPVASRKPDRIAAAGNSFGGVEAVLGAERAHYCAVVDAAGGAESWAAAPALRGQYILAAGARRHAPASGTYTYRAHTATSRC